MRHRMRGRKLGRTKEHRRALFRNLACALINSVVADEDDPNKPHVPGRIITTVTKAKEMRPIVEKLITLAKKALPHEEAAEQYATSATRHSPEWQEWRKSERWQKWAQLRAPAVTYRRRAFAFLRDDRAVKILFETLAPRFRSRPGGYTRVLKLPSFRVGDGARQAILEFVGERDRPKAGRSKAPKVRPD
ncbi:MAG: 50S ribosomal protein L17 [Planctomycetaceae bacterium]|nr:MAG: 50S ribosomal protein L17 [Planctomycetaceae bacterium]